MDKNIFKILSVSLLMCSMLSSAMEPLNEGPEKILLSIANQSERAVEAFFPILQMNQFNSFAGTIQPFEDQDSVVLKNGNAIIFTQLGTFTLAPDNADRPTYLVLSQDVAGHENQKLVVQEIPYHKSNNIIAIVNPNGSVSLAQGDAAQAEEKMNAIQQNAAQDNKNNDDAALRDKNFQKCSQCKVILEKTGGCNFVTCGLCRYQFCWICLGPSRDQVCLNSNCGICDADHANVQAIRTPQARIVTCNLDTKVREFINGNRIEHYCKASIIFDQEPSQQFRNNFINFLKQRLPKPTRPTFLCPILVDGYGTSISIRAPLLLTRDFLQCILDFANEHFAHQ